MVQTRSYLDVFIDTFSANLDFHGESSNYGSHNFHSFPAKFPPQLPKYFIENLTEPGDIVLDPMAGSATTILEGYLAGRQTIAFDIDPLAIQIAQVKTTVYDRFELTQFLERIVAQARDRFSNNKDTLQAGLNSYWDAKTKEFVDYWFDPKTQLQLYSLLLEIREIKDPVVELFFLVLFSSIIITKSGGVSLALDLGHTRPHKAKCIVDNTDSSVSIDNHQRKVLRSPFIEFMKKGRQNISGVLNSKLNEYDPVIKNGNAKALTLDDNYVDLILTSPPYASNAIDYMRAHKFSLVWFGYSIDDLSRHRNAYIGSESTKGLSLEILPQYSESIVQTIVNVDKSKGRALQRYYSEIKCVLKEMLRVLKPGKASILVVGNSVMKGIDTHTAECIADIGVDLGFESPLIGIRNLDRNRRMMPTSHQPSLDSQIQKRMHQEYIVGLVKPKTKGW